MQGKYKENIRKIRFHPGNTKNQDETGFTGWFILFILVPYQDWGFYLIRGFLAEISFRWKLLARIFCFPPMSVFYVCSLAGLILSIHWSGRIHNDQSITIPWSFAIEFAPKLVVDRIGAKWRPESQFWLHDCSRVFSGSSSSNYLWENAWPLSRTRSPQAYASRIQIRL